MEMSTLTVGEILAMFPSSKASWAGIGLLNQSICPDEIKSLVSITHTEAWCRGSKASYERKSLSVMEHIPWDIGGSEFLQDIFVVVKNERI
jgi:hypothetical protein